MGHEEVDFILRFTQHSQNRNEYGKYSQCALNFMQHSVISKNEKRKRKKKEMGFLPVHQFVQLNCVHLRERPTQRQQFTRHWLTTEAQTPVSWLGRRMHQRGVDSVTGLMFVLSLYCSLYNCHLETAPFYKRIGNNPP